MTLCRLALLTSVVLILHTPARADGDYDRRDGSYKTANFRTVAPTPELAKEFGDRAEFYRKQKAVEWLGEEMPTWPERCPLRVEINPKQSGGATTFNFNPGNRGVLDQRMKIWGDARQLLNSVLPHEVTHTVLAHHFGRPVPRWADEGGSVLSENEEEWFQHDVRCRELLNAERGIPLRILFTLKDYPSDVITVYAQGYSVCDFLINKTQGGRAKFLQFVDLGMRNDNRNWEAAVRTVYGFPNVDALEKAWINSLRTPPQRVSARAKGTPKGEVASARRDEVRSSGLGGVPLLDDPVTARGAPPDDDRPARKTPVGATPAARPTDAPPPIRLLLPPEPPRK